MKPSGGVASGGFMYTGGDSLLFFDNNRVVGDWAGELAVPE